MGEETDNVQRKTVHLYQEKREKVERFLGMFADLLIVRQASITEQR